jgi:dihydrofolate reductase
MISIIVAIATNGAIGKDNQLLWHISEDLKYFKKVTGGHTVIMGRKTWESIGRPLPNRRNIVISRTLKADSLPGAEVFGSLEEVIKSLPKADEHFVIGGGEIYRQALPLADKLYITQVYTAVPDADTFFPDIDPASWNKLTEEYNERGEKYPHPFEFVVYERR